jgi:hypothetical protein
MLLTLRCLLDAGADKTVTTVVELVVVAFKAGVVVVDENST